MRSPPRTKRESPGPPHGQPRCPPTRKNHPAPRAGANQTITVDGEITARPGLYVPHGADALAPPPSTEGHDQSRCCTIETLPRRLRGVRLYPSRVFALELAAAVSGAGSRAEMSLFALYVGSLG